MRRLLVTALLTVVALSGSSWAAQEKKPESKPAAVAPPAEPKIKVGDTPPDFTLKDQNRKDVQLSSYRGKKNIALAFFVFAFTGG